MIATIPIWLGIAALVVVGISLVIGVIYILFWDADVVVSGSLEDARDMARERVDRRARRVR